jgi:hypothetical protein
MLSRRSCGFAMFAACAGVAMPTDPVTLRSDVQALLRAGVHVSVVLGPDESLDTAVAEAPADAGRDVTEVFGKRWGPRFDVSSEPTRVGVRSARAPLCEASLARRIALNADGTPVELLFAIAKAADPSLAALPPPGLVNGGPAPEPGQGMPTQRIALSGKAVPIGRALDLMTESIDGLGWWAEERCSSSTVCRCRIGLITAGSVVFTSYDIASKPAIDPTR